MHSSVASSVGSGRSPGGRQINRSRGRPPAVPTVPVAKHIDADDDDDFWSDDSLQRDPKPAARSVHHEQDEISSMAGGDSLHNVSTPMSTNMSCVSALTVDTESFNTAVTTDSKKSKKRKKRKNEVWKMQPIPVKPYIPVPESKNDLRSP